MGSVDHVGLQEFEVGDVGVAALELAHLLDFLQFAQDEGRVDVAFAVDEGEDVVAVFPAVLSGQPTRRLGERDHAEEEQDGGDHLEGPGDTESLGAIEEGAAVGDAAIISQ